MTRCRASTATSHQQCCGGIWVSPSKWESSSKELKLTNRRLVGMLISRGMAHVHLIVKSFPSSFLLAIKSTLLFALLTGLRCSIFLFWICTTLTLGTNKCCNYVTVLTRLRCSKLLDILSTLLTNCVSFTLLLKFWSAVSTFYNRMCNPTFLAELLALRELLEGVALRALGAGVQGRRRHPAFRLLRARSGGASGNSAAPPAGSSAAVAQSR